jgi:cephalosporin hydroxylase
LEGRGIVDDDRKVFERARHSSAAGMAEDSRLTGKALEVVAESDRHNWSYQWSWLGVPIIQMPPDIVATQEVIWDTRPQVIVETGIARGGSLIFFASILELIGDGRIIGVDIDIRPHSRDSVESHVLARRIEMYKGSSTDPDVVDRIRDELVDADRVMVVLDSDHTHEHVLAELRLYAPLVTEGQFLIVADTVVEDLPIQGHRPRRWGPGNNPGTALAAFLQESDRFVRDPFINNKVLLSSSPGGYLRCVKP